MSFLFVLFSGYSNSSLNQFDESDKDSSNLDFDLQKYNSVKSNQNWVSDKHYSSKTEGIFKSSTSIFDTVNIAIAEVSQEFAVSTFTNFPDILDAVSITITFDSSYTSLNKLSGAIIIFEDVGEKLYMQVFKSGNGSNGLSLINTTPKYTDGVSLDNVLFVAINYLELTGLNLMGISGGNFICDNCLDDISLAKLSATHNMTIIPELSQ